VVSGIIEGHLTIPVKEDPIDVGDVRSAEADEEDDLYVPGARLMADATAAGELIDVTPEPVRTFRGTPRPTLASAWPTSAASPPSSRSRARTTPAGHPAAAQDPGSEAVGGSAAAG